MKNRFRRIVSIELSEDLCNQARARFRKAPHIQIVQGDSAEALPQVLDNISARCLFWLDGHYSSMDTAKGTVLSPIIKELQTIFAHKVKDHVILIDDARDFDGAQADYPRIDELRRLVAQNRPDYELLVANDVIRIHPKSNVPILV